MTTIPSVTLNNGVEIPQLGFGTYQVDPAEATEVVAQALEVGYRHIDTAEMYGNEAEVGAAIRASGLRRDEVFVTSKLDNPFHARGDALAAFDRTMDALALDQVDLFLIHWPQPTQDRYVEAWKALEEIHGSGRARAIGVSNFESEHLDHLAAECDITPAVNQIEVHPYLVQDRLRDCNAACGIATEAWSPIAQGDVLDDPAVTTIATDHGRTPAQVVLRWHLQRGDIVFPKTSSPERMAENLALFDFSLTDDEMARVSDLDRAGRRGAHPKDLG